MQQKDGGALSGPSVFTSIPRSTYDMMASWWPTPSAIESMPAVAERMNSLPMVRRFARSSRNSAPMLIMGSGSIVAQLAQAGLIDEYQIAVHPIVPGSGRTLFAGLNEKRRLTRTEARGFGNGNVFLRYEPR